MYTYWEMIFNKNDWVFNFLDILKNYAKLQTLRNRVIQFRICSQLILQSDNVVVDGYYNNPLTILDPSWFSYKYKSYLKSTQ